MLTTAYQIARRAYELNRLDNIPFEQAPLLNALRQVSLKYYSLQTPVPILHILIKFCILIIRALQNLCRLGFGINF